jgi:hypothetical protein
VLNSQRNLNMLARLGEERFMINGYQEERREVRTLTRVCTIKSKVHDWKECKKYTRIKRIVAWLNEFQDEPEEMWSKA